jgi:hypothetical protein
MKTQKAVDFEKPFGAEVPPVESVLERRRDGAILAFSSYSSV